MQDHGLEIKLFGVECLRLSEIHIRNESMDLLLRKRIICEYNYFNMSFNNWTNTYDNC